MKASDFAFFDSGFQAFAHRGGEHPGIGENSLRAFARAFELGYRYFETDVRATRDGVLLAFHDDAVDRLTGGRGLIAEQLAGELDEVRINGTDPIPTLAEVLEAFPHARFNIDLKAVDAIRPLLRLLDEHQAHDRVCVASFSPSRISTFRKLSGGRVATGLSTRANAMLAFAPVRISQFVSGAAAQVPSHTLGGRLPLVTRRFVATAHRCGRRVHVWTINEAAEMHRLIDLGVDGIMTDRLEVLKNVLVERGLWEGAR